MQVNIYEAKTRLSELVKQARQGQTVVIAKNGTPLAKLVALDAVPKPAIVYGLMKGEFIEADDFDAPCRTNFLSCFPALLNRASKPDDVPVRRSSC